MRSAAIIILYLLPLFCLPQTVGFDTPQNVGACIELNVTLTDIADAGAISIKIAYDTNKLQFLEAVPDSILFQIGVAFYSNTSYICLTWFTTSMMPYTGTKPFKLRFLQLGGCDSLRFATCQGCCEIADVFCNVIPCVWEDTQLCAVTTGIRKIPANTEAIKRNHYNLLGQRVK